MISVKKALLLLFMISVLVLLSVYYFQMRSTTQSDSAASGTDEATSGQIETATDAGQSQTVESGFELEQDGSASSSAEEVESDTENPSDASPFATVESDVPDEDAKRDIALDAELSKGEARETEAIDSTSSEPPLDTIDDVSNQLSDPIIVPESYPISEAARYFVPKEDRRPGNLGGPPPLDFPGGPNQTEEGDTGDTLQPPVPTE